MCLEIEFVAKIGFILLPNWLLISIITSWLVNKQQSCISMLFYQCCKSLRLKPWYLECLWSNLASHVDNLARSNNKCSVIYYLKNVHFSNKNCEVWTHWNIHFPCNQVDLGCYQHYHKVKIKEYFVKSTLLLSVLNSYNLV